VRRRVVPFSVAPVSPIARDPITEGRWPVVAARLAHDGRRGHCRASVTHSYAALAFYTGGQAHMELNGRWTIGEGDVLLVPAGEPHRMLDMQAAEFWGLTVCVACLAADGNTSLLEPLQRVRDGAPPVVHIPPARRAYLDVLFQELERIGREPRGASDVVHRSLLTLISAEIDNASGASSMSGGLVSGVVSDALRFIERNCLGRLTLGDVAAAVGRSPAHITTALTRATGRSAVQWIVSGRMAAARRFLLSSDERVDVIAERVGYADATHFIRMFRREHGATPAAWRVAQASGARLSR
jgi:AraC-like DNA-binding protein